MKCHVPQWPRHIGKNFEIRDFVKQVEMSNLEKEYSAHSVYAELH